MNLAENAVTFLRTVERRDLDTARGMMSERPTIVFPRGAVYDSLDTCAADRSTRYHSIRKEIEGTHVASQEDGATAVYVFGTLHGEANDGSPIRGVRFIDRLTYRNGRIARHDVWNDLAL